MKVKDLIATLQTLDYELRVFVDGYKGGYDDPMISKPCKFRAQPNAPYYVGRFDADDKGRIKAIVIGRKT